MLTIETHCHSLGGSACGTCSADEIIGFYKSVGYDGIVLTNHYSKAIIDDEYKAKTDVEAVDKFFALYELMKEKGEKVGLKIFYGIEVRINCTQTEYMIYGFDKQFLYDNPRLFELDQKQLFELCENNGLFMYQTHPFREGVVAGNPAYLHGAESFNGHYHHVNNNALATEFCNKHNLIKMAGTDFHHDDQPITSAMFIPEYINTESELAKYFLSGKAQSFTDEEYYQKELKKHKEKN